MKKCFLILFILIVSVGLICGCGLLKSKTPGVGGKTSSGKASGGEGKTLKGTENFQGYYLKVWVDGKQTKKGPVKSGEQRWEAAAGDNPTIKFEYNKDHLGDMKTFAVDAKPLKANGMADFTVIMKFSTQRYDTGAKKMVNIPGLEAGKDFKLCTQYKKCFSKMAAGKITYPKSLPKGKYLLNVTINGKKTWDRQYIILTVK